MELGSTINPAVSPLLKREREIKIVTPLVNGSIVITETLIKLRYTRTKVENGEALGQHLFIITIPKANPKPPTAAAAH